MSRSVYRRRFDYRARRTTFPLESVTSLVKLANETEQISEATNLLKAITQFGDNTENINEAINRLQAQVRSADETVNVAEALNRLQAQVRPELFILADFSDDVGDNSLSNWDTTNQGGLTKTGGLIDVAISGGGDDYIYKDLPHEIVAGAFEFDYTITDLTSVPNNSTFGSFGFLDVSNGKRCYFGINKNGVGNLAFSLFRDTDGGTSQLITGITLPTQGVTYRVRVEARSSTGAGQNNGRIVLTVKDRLNSITSSHDSDTIAYDRFVLGSVGADSVTASVTIDNLRVWDGTGEEIVYFLESVNRVLGLSKTEGSDTEQISEATNYLRSKFAIANDGVDVSEATNRLQSQVRVVNETVQIGEATNRLQAQVRVVDETVQIGEATNYVHTIIQVVDETVNIGEATNRLADLVVVGDTAVQISEATNRLMAVVTQSDDTEQISEATNRLQAQVRVVDESVNIGEAVNRLQAQVRVDNDTVNIGEATNKVLEAGAALLRVVNETEQVSEAVNRAQSQVRNVADTVQISEATNRLQAQVRIVDETVNIGEQVNYLKTIITVVNETVNISEATNYLKTIVSVVDETVNVGEASNLLLSQVRVVDTAVQIGEATNRVLTFVRVVDETVNIGEATNKVISGDLIKFGDDAVNIGEATNKVATFIRVVDETEQISEAVNRLMAKILVVDESVNIGETVNFLKSSSQVVNESEDIGETVNSLIGKVLVVNEGINISEQTNDLIYLLAIAPTDDVSIGEDINTLIVREEFPDLGDLLAFLNSLQTIAVRQIDDVPVPTFDELSHRFEKFNDIQLPAPLTTEHKPFGGVLPVVPVDDPAKLGFLYSKLGDTVQTFLSGRINDYMFYTGDSPNVLRRFRNRIIGESKKFSRGVGEFLDEEGTRGFVSLPGKSINRLQDDLADSRVDIGKINEELYVEELTEIAANVEFALKAANQNEIMLFDSHHHCQAITFEGAAKIVDNAFAVYTLEVAKFNSQLEAYNTFIDTRLNQFRSKILALQEVDISIRGKLLTNENEMLRNKMFAAAVNYIAKQVDATVANIDAIEVIAEQQRATMLQYKSEVDRFTALVNANVAEFNVYKANVRKELVKLDKFKNELQSAEARLNSEEAETALNRVIGESAVDEARANLQVAEAELRAAKNLLTKVLLQADVTTEEYRNELLDYAAALKDWSADFQRDLNRDLRAARRQSDLDVSFASGRLGAVINRIDVDSEVNKIEEIRDIIIENTERMAEIQLETHLTTSLIQTISQTEAV